MKISALLLPIACLLIITSCTQKESTNDPQERLAALKKQAKEINDEIKSLQAQIAQSDTSQSSKSKLVAVDTLFTTDFAYYIDVQGTVESDLNVLAAPQMPGIVTAIYVKEGDQVPQGKILASLDASTVRKAMDEVNTGLTLAQTLYEKQKRLWDQQIGSEAQFLQAKNQKDQLEQKLKTLEAQLAMSYIKAPVSGTVDVVQLKLGEMASPGFNGIRVVNNHQMSIKANLSDKYLEQVKKGDPVIVEIPETNQQFRSSVKYCSNSISTQTRTFSIEIAIPSGQMKYKSNQALRLKINSKNVKKALVISSNLIQTSISGEEYILVAEQSNGFWFAKRKNIVTGISYQGKTEVTSGLTEGDKIITDGFSELVDGQMIAL